MSAIPSLRSAVLLAGGQPTQYTHVGLLRELISAWGGTPTQYTINILLKEAIVTAGGSVTVNRQVELLRLLITTLGGTPTSYVMDDLWSQLSLLNLSPVNAPHKLTSPTISVAGGAFIVGKVVTIDPGTWTNSPTAFHYQLYADGVAIGTDSTTYTLTSGEIGKNLTARVQAVNVNGSGYATTAIYGPVVAQPLMGNLSLSNSSFNENTAAATVIGAIGGLSVGGTVAFAPSGDAGGRVAISSGNLVVGTTNTDFDVDGSTLSITLRETNSGASNGPTHDTVLTLAVGNLNDTNPSAFTFTDLSSVAASTRQSSNTITLAGMGASDTVTVTASGDASARLYKNGVLLGGLSTTGVNGDQFAVDVIASASDGGSVSVTLTAGATTDTFTVGTLSSTISAFTIGFAPGYVAGSAITAFAISNLDLDPGSGQVTAGDVIVLEDVDAAGTPLLNADNTYLNGSGQTVRQFPHTLTESEITTAEDGAGNLLIDWTQDHYTSPSGAGKCHAFIRRDDGVTIAISPMTNELSYNISASVAKLTSSTGPMKAALISLSPGNLQFTGSPGVGSWYGIAADRDGSTKCQVDTSLDAIGTEGDNAIGFGRFNAASTDMSAGRPGVANALGYIIQTNFTTSVFDLFRNSAGNDTGWTAPNANQVGDVFSDECDTSGAALTHSVKLRRTRAGATVTIGTLTGVTMTGFTRDHVFVRSNVKGTKNYGGSTYAVAPEAGYASVYA